MSPVGAATSGGRARLADFSCSNPLLDRIYNQSLWTKSNLVTGGMSVDCPHRERLGYIGTNHTRSSLSLAAQAVRRLRVPAGDAHTSLETSLQNFASAPFYTKWAQDIADIQGYPAHTGCGYGVCHLPEGLDDPVGYIAHTAPTIDGGGGPGCVAEHFVLLP